MDEEDAILVIEVSPGIYMDKQLRKVNRRGYLIDMFGNAIDQEGNEILAKDELYGNGELPGADPNRLVKIIKKHK
jgi:hypothetical protein